MGNSTTVEIIQSAEQRKEVDDNDPIVIDELFNRVSNERFDEAFGIFSRLTLPSIGTMPLYDMLWPRFATSFNTFHTLPQGLSHIVILYQELENEVRDREPDQINCYGVDPYYLSTIADLARNEEIAIKTNVRVPKWVRIKGFLEGLISLLIVLLDNFLSLFLKRLFPGANDNSNVIFVPHLGRFSAMKPVIDAADYEYKIVAPITILDWLRRGVLGQASDIANYRPIPISNYVSVKVLIKEIQSVLRLVNEELISGRFRDNLIEAVDAEFGIRIDRSISHSLGNIYPLHLSAIPNLYLADRMIKVTDCQRIVVGAQSLRQLSILIAAQRQGILTFHIPHAVLLRHEPVPRTGTYHLVPGPASERYLKESDHIHDESPIIPMGRPLFASLVKDRKTRDGILNHDEIRIVIATQPYSDEVRHEYVSKIIDMFKRIDRPVSIAIKIHPNETTHFYTKFQNETNPEVSIVDEDLHEHLKWADLTFVINSNVGLESMILGTPCVVVNMWNPKMFVRPSLQTEAIPLIENDRDLSEFVGGLNEATINSLRENQIAYVDENFIPNSDISNRIADFIVECEG